MAVSQILTDSWIQHLPFMTPRPSPFGPIDGLWYGVGSVVGDASGGTIQTNLNLSFDRKEDWVYQVKAYCAQINADVNADVRIDANTGPLVPTPTVVENPTFSVSGNMDSQSNLAITTYPPHDAGRQQMQDLLMFGDKRIAGVYTMFTALWTPNTDLALHTLSVWGFLFKYQSFFRGVPPALA